MNLNPTFPKENGPDMTGWYFFEAAFSPLEVVQIKNELAPIPFTGRKLPVMPRAMLLML